MAEDRQTGLIHIYTGEGKGKTTSACGLSVRAKSRGFKVMYAQFMKSTKGGELDLLRELGIDVVRFREVVSPHFNRDVDMGELRQEALKAIDTLNLMFPDYDMAVLDEFNLLLHYNLLTSEEALGFLRGKPERMELILTGRGAPDWIMEEADLVTEMREIKHPARKGVPARQGIEF